ncbi:hypothetical protein [Mycobacteroides abscessus]|uniref:hypothetical protein n=1 Tax=Mycobacteroides abscessus TaxID=36809 RepID=UPI000C2561A0|nr:hypothetical protein [Mycobacteroides abscessus]RIS70542.1 hypothetical protein D2E54_24330 [Mycobacteroides abscessus]
MDELGSPAAIDPTHFVTGDEVTSYDGGRRVEVVIDATPDREGYILVGRGQDRVRSAVRNLVHAHGCARCALFTEEWRAPRASRWQQFRDSYTERARGLADALRHSGLVSKLIMGPGGAEYTLTLDPQAPLPAWLHEALSGARFELPEGSWPQWGRTQHAADWATLIAEHPDVLVPDHGMLRGNGGASWPSIAEAFTYARTLDASTYMDVALWVESDGRISVEPIAMFTTTDLLAENAAHVDEILIAGGRDADLLHDPRCAPPLNSWTLNC